jgi:hypothetical protein
LNKSSYSLKIQKLNTQTLQLFEMTIKTGSNLNAKLEGLGEETKWSRLQRREAQALLE